jgi:hypothetical protein
MERNLWRYVDLRHQKNGQIRIFNPADEHIANVLASDPNALNTASFIVEACNLYRSMIAGGTNVQQLQR